jgi:hypothetical protein
LGRSGYGRNQNEKKQYGNTKTGQHFGDDCFLWHLSPLPIEKEQPLSRKKVRNVNIGMQNIINNECNNNLLLKKDLDAQLSGIRAFKKQV